MAKRLRGSKCAKCAKAYRKFLPPNTLVWQIIHPPALRHLPPVPMSNLAHLEWITANLENAKLFMQHESDNKREADKLIARV